MRTVRNIIMPAPAAPPPALAVSCDEVRCGCGSLLARVVGAEVELKCRRCKHVWRVALETDGDPALRSAEPPHRRREVAR
jgi:phage FluMu protein Com